jgi:hypothetical protein
MAQKEFLPEVVRTKGREDAPAGVSANTRGQIANWESALAGIALRNTGSEYAAKSSASRKTENGYDEQDNSY